MKDVILNTLQQSRDLLDDFLGDAERIAAVEEAAGVLIGVLEEGGRIFSCGNGGSMSDAMHFAEELSGRYRENRAGLAATAISDPGHISCVANDFGFEHIFSRYLEACARPGDCLVGISTSGTSKNVLKAAQYAREHGLRVISLTGRGGSLIGDLADVDLAVGYGEFADRTQELHIKVIHILIELVERHFFPENYY